MAARKLANEVERCFKKVAEGVASFEGIYDKMQQTSNPSQKEKLEDALKKEIKKLQRSRDQIKAWAATNDIKDKKPLLEQRKLIETQMEKFKAVEKEMKTKAYSKIGLSAASKLDPKEKEKLEMCQFLSNMVEELERQIETAEAETESLQANVKKGKKDNSKADRISELERATERHKWHQNKLELLLRALENGSVETEQVKDLEESIRYYVESNTEVDFMEDDSIYDDLDLQEEEDLYGMNNEADRVSSQDTQSIQDEAPDLEPRQPSGTAGKPKPSDGPVAARRPSTQLKSPLPALATLHTPAGPAPNGTSSGSMKPAPLPSRIPGEPLKYASAAAAAAASDKNGVGIAPLPPPPGANNTNVGLAPLPSASTSRTSAASSPAAVSSQPATQSHAPVQRPTASIAGSADGISSGPLSTKSPALSHSSIAVTSTEASSIPPTPALEKVEGASSQSRKPSSSEEPLRIAATKKASEAEKARDQPSIATESTLTNGEADIESEETESIFHLPSSLQDLVDTFEAAQSERSAGSTARDERLFATSHATCPESIDAERPRHYKPNHRFPYIPPHYPQEPLAIFDDFRLYNRVDTDTLFYAFYYRQGTYEQFLAARALKSQSWRFHKQYQTWFQRHEEPKQITEDYEQGTYRFFDYESTWMNRRKADFKFAYKFLEDDL